MYEAITGINNLTLKIEQEYQALYQYQDENSITIPCCCHPKVDTKNFFDYLDKLKQLLKHHTESQINKRSN